MKITYIAHSGFMVELEKTVLLFDYYKGEIPDISTEKSLCVFVSHKHEDHYNKEILRLAEKYQNIHFFLSKDIKIRDYQLKKLELDKSILNKVTYLARNAEYVWKHQPLLDGKQKSFNDFTIRTLASTDAGVAFCIKCEGKQIYHAGDLNWWHWNGETKAYNRNMEVNYKREIDSLRGYHFHIAFLPLDGRLEDAYGYGMRYFMEHVKCDYVFPMHMWNHYELIDTFIGENEKIDTKSIIRITKEGMSWNM